MRVFLKENPEIANEIEEQIRAKLLPTIPVEELTEETETEEEVVV